MRTINISDLKAHLSAHIQFVKNGEEVLVCDRNQPVVRIMPLDVEHCSAQQRRLIASGVLQPPLKRRRANALWPKPPGKVADEMMEQLWREEREGR